MNLTRYEQEVVINLNADEDMATVYMANPAWIRKMDALVREFPDVFSVKRWTKSVKLICGGERADKYSAASGGGDCCGKSQRGAVWQTSPAAA